MVHCTYLGMSGYFSFKKCIFVWRYLLYLNSVDPDEMQHYPGLPCLQMFSFSGLPNTKGSTHNEHISSDKLMNFTKMTDCLLS